MQHDLSTDDASGSGFLHRHTFDTLAAAGLWREDVTYKDVQAALQLAPKKLPAMTWVALFFSNVALVGLGVAIGDLVPSTWQGLYAVVIITLWLLSLSSLTWLLENVKGYIDRAAAQWLYAVIGANTSAWGLAVGHVMFGDFGDRALECALLPPTLWGAVLLVHGRTLASGTFMIGLVVAWVQYTLFRMGTRFDSAFYTNLFVASGIYFFGHLVDTWFAGLLLVPWQSFAGPASALYLGILAATFEIRIDVKYKTAEPAYWLDWLLVAVLAIAPITYRAYRTNSQVAWVLSFGMIWVAVALATNYLSGPLGRLLGWFINLVMGVLGMGLAMWVRQRKIPTEEDDEIVGISMNPA
jgi:hypothetical protein|eukprot:CAMPEP_0174295026 /NCGR_PEP_ID=MMETSP0809-20121228/43411_1 /TAXON_ID=73025 ORGANISM="Eutreptiella gymnastica-like, Strain CCMP1594" /NCGR_SAMPLE_ID=MMETSP0809 /ASSEMBLY_ACC=CAM_ASM_000658 /LENGTH=353 /DNA_ID=CAMNT_0015396943 /DNA_START=26 /DNA_END=1087 /DNA_ORIENTATION=+